MHQSERIPRFTGRSQLAKVLGGRANARAYTDGADLNQLVNAQRGIRTAQIDGRNIKYTTEAPRATDSPHHA